MRLLESIRRFQAGDEFRQIGRFFCHTQLWPRQSSEGESNCGGDIRLGHAAAIEPAIWTRFGRMGV